MITTGYGFWHPGDSCVTVEDTVGQALGEFGDDYDTPALTVAYRDAVNDALPTGVTLNGNDFYGPYPCIDVDLAAVIASVDFWSLASQHERGSK